jgi:hypothetical protein
LIEVAADLLREVLSKKESVTYQAILREGREEGRAEGVVQGALAEAKKWLLLQGEAHFGAPDRRTRAALDQIEDVGQLEQMSLRLLSAVGWPDLLGQPTPRRRAD